MRTHPPKNTIAVQITDLTQSTAADLNSKKILVPTHVHNRTAADTLFFSQGMQSLIEAGRSVDGNGATVRSAASTTSLHSNVSGLLTGGSAARPDESRAYADTGRNRSESG
jgi:hypothetical protein